MKRFVRFALGNIIDLNKTKLGYSVYNSRSFNGGSATNEFIGQGDKLVWIQDITELELQADNPLELLESQKDLIEFRTVKGYKIRTFSGRIKLKNEKLKYQLDGAQCLERHIRAIWFRVGVNIYERLELEKNGK